jgi:site-specific recombinase XerD
MFGRDLVNDVVLAGAQIARHRWVRRGLVAPALIAETKERWPWCGGCMDQQLTQLAQFSTGAEHALLPQWQAAMRAEAKSPGTIDTYTHGLRTYLIWCATTGEPPLHRNSMTTWMREMLAAGAAPGSARIRRLGVRRFVAWLIATGHVPVDPFAGIKGPKQTQKLVTPLTDDQLRALIATCATPTHRPDEPLHHRRDEAIIRLMFETGVRIGETIALQVDDVALDARRVTIRRGKGGPGRVIPIGPSTSAALRAYLAHRAHHRCAESSELWLGERGRGFCYDGLSRALRRRARLAGITGFHPHKLRHTAAHRWLAAGGSESGLMAIAGWTRTDMLVRYTRVHASERAAEEATRLDLGHL